MTDQCEQNSSIETWLPGVLCESQQEELFNRNVIKGERPAEFGESSFDLTISEKAWEMGAGSLKPSEDGFRGQLDCYPDFIKKFISPGNGEFILQRDHTYIFQLQQCLDTALVKHFQIYGMATAKSSIGRLDVLARLIVDGMDCYEGFKPNGKGNGCMYVEVTPLSFDIKVKVGKPITQLRLFLGDPDKCEIRSDLLHQASIIDGPKDGYLRVDLSNVSEGGIETCSFCAKPAIEIDAEPIPAYKTDTNLKPTPESYWERLPAEFNKSGGRFLKIQPRKFYILRSKEKIALHSTTAVYCMAIDETIGEMRIHYAGFVHPWFGRNRNDGTFGTPLIFEVRGHDVPIILQDGEKLAKIRYYQMSKEAKKVEASASGGTDYQEQILKLSTFFNLWQKPSEELSKKT